MKYAFLPGLLAVAATAQDPNIDRVTVPFSDAARPRIVKVGIMNGSITVKAHEGKEAIVEARHKGTSQRLEEPRADGLRRIGGGSSGLNIEEQDNVIKIGSHYNRSMDVTVYVPAATSLQLKTNNGGRVEVEGIDGEIEASNLNGEIRLTGVSGSAIAHTLNGAVTAVFNRVNGAKPMSFSSLNGAIDVTLPPETKARLKMKTHRGEVWSDFDVKMETSTPPVVEDGKGTGVRYRVRIDRGGIAGTINGGGPEYQLTTHNGAIFIRKKK